MHNQGLGEGVALPSMNNLVASHVPPSAKARALGMCFSGFHSGEWVGLDARGLSNRMPARASCRPTYAPPRHGFKIHTPNPTLAGNLLGLLLSPFILLTFGWRALFMVFGVLGAPLLAVWNASVPDKPSPQQQQQKQQQLASAPAPGGAAGGKEVTLSRLMLHPATWAIIAVNFVNHWGYFIYLNWMPTYFSKVGVVRLFVKASFGASVVMVVDCMRPLIHSLARSHT
jgi:predicted MFS family arabinose efflux permease